MSFHITKKGRTEARQRQEERAATLAARAARRQELLTRLQWMEDGRAQAPYSLFGDDECRLSQGELIRWKTVSRELSHKLAYADRLQSFRKLQESRATAQGSDAVDVLFNMTFILIKNEDTREQLEREVGVTVEEVKASLDVAVQSYYQQLLANREDPLQFTKLRELINRTKKETVRGFPGDLYNVGIMPLAYPGDWNNLVAQHHATPSITAFIGLPGRGPGDVRLLAAEALRTDSLTQAQIALAYCNSNHKCREAVGDVLTAELAKLVEATRAALNADRVTE